mmetsp:Transcript_30912/g.102229  ORF Transcript_30912/g.102229 Transcript_30912/m.102229 type:complete len:320 (-) Transcript_30912:306-1265(-)
MADLVDTAAGCVGATACTLGGLPFDVAKARLQAGGAGHAYSGLADCLLTTARTEGALALYRGMVPALSSALAENSVGITVQRSLRRALGVDDGGQRPSVGTELGLGAVTGVFTSVAICPFEVLKVRLQLNHDLVDAGPAALLRELRSLVGSEGLSGLYRGIGSLVCRDVPYNTLFYGSYESLCTLFMRLTGVQRKEELATGWVFLSGGLGGCIGWSLVLPFDVVKTRVQSGAESRALPLVRRIVATEGVQGLFRGWTAAVVRAFPANACLFLGVEVTTRLLRPATSRRDATAVPPPPPAVPAAGAGAVAALSPREEGRA